MVNFMISLGTFQVLAYTNRLMEVSLSKLKASTRRENFDDYHTTILLYSFVEI